MALMKTPSQKERMNQLDQEVLLLYNAREGPIEAMELTKRLFNVPSSTYVTFAAPPAPNSRTRL